DKESKAQGAHNFCIIDEIDSILIDESRTPLIISGAAEDDTVKYSEANKLVDAAKECAKDPDTGEYPEEPVGDFKVEEKNKRISFTDEGMNHIEQLLQQQGLIHGTLFDSDNFEFIHYCTQSLKAKRLFHRDVDYVVQNGKVEIVDEFTGRILHGRRYSEGLHQAIEAKEGVPIQRENLTLATITLQNFFRMYEKLAGMTGTAWTEREEFNTIYGLDVLVAPTDRPMIRDDESDIIYRAEDGKYPAVVGEIEEMHAQGRPVLVGTVSIENSERLADLLKRRSTCEMEECGEHHKVCSLKEPQVLNAKHHEREAAIIAQAGRYGAVTIATNMAGRGTDIVL
ncbi:hypothetical protein LCGC14_3135970, partial [marine sediment metagenome]